MSCSLLPYREILLRVKYSWIGLKKLLFTGTKVCDSAYLWVICSSPAAQEFTLSRRSKLILTLTYHFPVYILHLHTCIGGLAIQIFFAGINFALKEAS